MQVILLGILIIVLSVFLAMFLNLIFKQKLLKDLKKKKYVRSDLKYKEFKEIELDMYAYAIGSYLEKEKNPTAK